MPDVAVAQEEPKRRLANKIRGLLSNEVTNGYSTLSPRIDNSGNVIMKVKDSQYNGTLTITITEDK